MMNNPFAVRRDFMQRFDMAAPDAPSFQPQALAMWQTMLQEEWQEFQTALADYQAMPQADAATQQQLQAELTAEGVDVLNVLCGLLLSQGLPLQAMFDAIHAANLAKCVDGQVLRRADGKILKPAGWQPADKVGVIRAATQQQPDTSA
ncbi:nucleoside triphosphate pyrophosphohydrolase family protein [Vogesella urethralis]|uniref:nucleoside triphosphate pyrophosphohydrolase family protein n=1 Tax=Vogesella urethralis TaxID=2592656 RepID=UPI001F0F65F7|nr:nucleoside triphosphate pyrophosphohydrolase family protein [Vogesella urethralis]